MASDMGRSVTATGAAAGERSPAGGGVRRRIDLSAPILALLGLGLAVLVLLPLGWLVVYAVTDKAGALTAGNFIRLATDPTFVTPFLTTLAIAIGVAACSCLVA